MMMTRRKVIKTAAAVVVATTLIPNISAENSLNISKSKRPKVLFFDSNETMFDLKGMKPQVTAAFNGRDELMALWFATMLHYSLVDTVVSNYHSFGEIGAACMQMIAEGNGINLDLNKAKKAMQAMKTLPVHPDIPEGLKKLKAHGFKLYTFTNSASMVIESQVKSAHIDHYFNGRLTTEGLNIYKPHPRTYHWVSNEVGEPIGNCMLIAAHGWDVAGATITGMRAAFVERPGKTLYPLGPDIELKGKTLIDIANQLIAMEH